MDAFEVWERTQLGTWELHDGQAVALAPKEVDHATIKANVRLALGEALRGDRIGCEVSAEGSIVQVAENQRFQPDAMVTHGVRLSDSCDQTGAPIIVVEVLSPSTQYADFMVKLAGYFDLPSVQHYLIVSFGGRLVVHHRRMDGLSLLTSFHYSGSVILDPPGISIDVGSLHRGTDIHEVRRSI